jgi:hypothetical protein
MQKPSGFGTSQKQNAWEIFVIGVILNDRRLCPRFFDFPLVDITFNRPLEGMPREFNVSLHLVFVISNGVKTFKNFEMAQGEIRLEEGRFLTFMPTNNSGFPTPSAILRKMLPACFTIRPATCIIFHRNVAIVCFAHETGHDSLLNPSKKYFKFKNFFTAEFAKDAEKSKKIKKMSSKPKIGTKY